MSTREVDDYLEQLDEAQRSTLERLRQTIAAVIPEAEQGMSYGVPAFSIAGKAIAGFTASKGALKFPVGRPPSEALVRKLIAARRSEAQV